MPVFNTIERWIKHRICSNPRWVRCTWIILVSALLINSQPGIGVVSAQQETTPQEKAQELLARLTPEERVGQLFLVTFVGNNVGEDSQIYDLIVDHHIGGAVLLAANDNIMGEDTLEQISIMNRQLQLNRWAAAQQPQTNPDTGETKTLHYIPLFIGTYQEGDGPPYDQILNGLTLLPNAMASGATWNTDLAQEVGNVLGAELAALGINLLIGPSLDVLETPKLIASNDLGTRTFGGDPFWVGEMGQAYITGVHQGSGGRIATIAKHFPGNGGADRPTEEEVATVRKSLDQLTKIDLVPFFGVTGNAPTKEATTDGLLASHIRYQGFQENIRATTRPVSFDPQAFNQLMSLPALTAWRENGGVMVSDNLGSLAVRRFYELTGQVYESRRVVLNAFLAGNDMLYLGDMSNGEDTDSYTAILRALDFFTQKYQQDPDFAQKVDESVLRILTLKFRLYPVFNLSFTLPLLEGIDGLGQANQVAFETARQAATLISPSVEELDIAIPDPPNQSDRIVFISDTRSASQCSQCAEQTSFSDDALQQAVIRLYGPEAGSQVLPYNLVSYSNEDLIQMLDGPRNTTQLEVDLRRAQWIAFSMLDMNQVDPLSQALPRFLAERPDLFQQKRMIVFAFNAPYYLDATNISKLTAYYGLYTKIPSAVDVAARLLFREITPTGILPVSVPGVGYDLITATSPDPNQVIPLSIDQPAAVTTDQTATPVPLPTPEFQIGSIIPVRTGMILDHNGHRVPDGTPVQFILTLEGVVNSLPQIEITVGGVASTNIQVNNPGALEIRVESEPAKQSEILRFDIPGNDNIIETPTATEQPTETPTLTPTSTQVPPIIITPQPTEGNHLDLADWFIAILLATITGFLSYRLAVFVGQVRWGIRSGFFALIGGLIAYCYLALAFPGSDQMLESIGGWGVILVTGFGCALGLLTTLMWRSIRRWTGREI